MIPERIGTMGKIHGVNPRRMPPPKNVATISQKFPERSSVPTSELSDFAAPRRPGAVLVSAGPAAGGAAAGCSGLSRPAVAREAPVYAAASVRSKLRLLGG